MCGNFQSLQVTTYFLFVQLEFQDYLNNIDSILFCWKTLPFGKVTKCLSRSFSSHP